MVYNIRISEKVLYNLLRASFFSNYEGADAVLRLVV